MSKLLKALILSILVPMVFSTVLFAQEPSAALHKLLQSEWDYEMGRNPVWASLLGDRRGNDRWDDLSLAGLTAQQQHHIAVLEQLKAVERQRLSPGDQLTYDVAADLYTNWIEEDKFQWYLVPENHMSGLPETFRMPPGVQAAGQLAANLNFESTKDYEDWNARLSAFPAYVDQVMALMREGMRTGRMNPKVVMERIPPQIERQLVDRSESSAFFAPFAKFPDSVPAERRGMLAATARERITISVLPALRRFRDFLQKEYIPAAPEQVGIWQFPSGDNMYAFFVRRYTGAGLTPAQVHQLGLSEVKRIRGEMEALMRQTGFQGSLQDFFAFLRNDPRFYYSDGQQLLMAYRNLAKRIDPRLLKVIKTLPRAPYGVEPTPAATAPDATTGFYYPGAPDGSRAGTYLVNLYRPETRPRWEMTALTLHEAVPGHHTQSALALEMTGVPNLRRYADFTAYVEGWALYSETRLGYDLEMYGDPYDRFGQLAYEMWRAVRLVVDTGMHSMHWKRQQAIDYFLENTPRQQLDVTNEVDRYIASPGQALAYKIGELKIRELREQAQKELGPAFNLREFHDCVLETGPVPLTTLERHVHAWIAARKGR